VFGNSKFNEIMDLDEEAINGKKRKKSYEVSKKCQDAWMIARNTILMSHIAC